MESKLYPNVQEFDLCILTYKNQKYFYCTQTNRFRRVGLLYYNRLRKNPVLVKRVEPLERDEYRELFHFYGKNQTVFKQITFWEDLLYNHLLSKIYIFYTMLAFVYFLNEEYMFIYINQFILWMMFFLKRWDYNRNIKKIIK